MRVWTEATFNAALKRDPDSQDPILWLASHDFSERRPSRVAATLDAIDAAGTRAGRLTVVLCAGLLVCSVLPNSALAPVSRAHAAIDRFKLQPVYPARLEEVSEPVNVAPEGGLPPSASTSSPVVPCNKKLQLAPAVLNGAAPVAPLGEDLAAVHQVRTAHPQLEPAPDQIQHPSFEESREEVEEFLRFGSRQLPRRLVETIVRAAQATDVDPIYLMALADKESSFRTEVKASTSSAEGLFQFIERTWLDTVKKFGPKHGLAAEAGAIGMVDDRIGVADDAERTRILALRRDPYLAAVMAAEMLRRDAMQIGFKIGRQVNATEAYLAHFLGLQDAARFIALRGAKKAQSATAAFPAAARANAAIFFEKGKRGRRKGLSVPEVYAKIDRMIDSRIELYRPVTTYASAGPNS